MNGSTCQTTSEPRAAIEPACQNRKTSIACSSSSTRAEVSAYSRALTAVPARASVTGVGPPRPPAMPSANTRDAGDEGAGQAEPDVGEQAGGAEQDDRGDHRERRALRDAEQAGVGERVAGVALHERAGDAEREPGQHAEHGPGDAQRADDDVVLGAGRGGERVPGVGQGHRFRADGDAQRHGQQEAREQDRAGRGAAGDGCRAGSAPRRSNAPVSPKNLPNRGSMPA